MEVSMGSEFNRTVDLVQRGIFLDKRRALEVTRKIYQNAIGENLNKRSLQEIAKRTIDIIASSADISEMHERYRQDVHDKYDLTEIMKNFCETRADKLSEIILCSVRDAAAILDYGCGGGDPAFYLKKKTNSLIVGADIADIRASSEIKNDIPFVKICEKDSKIASPEARFDALSLAYVLHHAPEDAHKNIIAELARVAANNAPLIILETMCVDEKERLCGESATSQTVFIDFNEEQRARAAVPDFITSNFCRGEPTKMQVPGNYHRYEHWLELANEHGFELQLISKVTVDALFQEASVEMVFSRSSR
jgi:SAM-dependent methyltransferase